MERSFLDYSMSVITARALPDARDGLKPVHRRILWGMYDMRARPDRPTLKCARVTGDVMGKYHPHGDSAIYDALVRMGQPFSLRHPLVHPKGNFGSLDDPPAAARYTECRLTPIALHMLADIDENTVDFADNYSGEVEEPLVLPSRFPNLLVNGSQGIAVGMATNIPPHNLGEVIDATVHLLENPEATPDELMEFVKGPDFPTGGLIMGRSGILDAYRTGKGSIKLRGKAEIEEGQRSDRIVVTSLPYQVSPNALMTKIKELVDNRELEGIADLNDESSGKTGMRIVIKLKRDAPALVILNNLYKRTPLQTNFAVNTVALVDGIPRTLNLRDALVAYLDHQVEVITRRSEYRLDEARKRAHIVEGLIKALDLIDQIIAAIRAVRGQARGQDGADGRALRVQRGAGRAHPGHAAVAPDPPGSGQPRGGDGRAAGHHRRARGHPGRRRQAPRRHQDELGEVREKYATARRSEITYDVGDLDIEDLIDDEDLVVTMSAKGYIKTVAADAFRTQGRGGRGVAGAKLRDEDYVNHIIHTSAHAYLLFFSNLGRVYRLKAHEIPMKDRTARGTAIVNLLPLQPGETIQAIIDTRDYETNRFLFFATRNGQVKKTKFTEYDSSLRAGLIAINLRDGDELVRVIPTNGGDDIFMVSRGGHDHPLRRGRGAGHGPGRGRRAGHEAQARGPGRVLRRGPRRRRHPDGHRQRLRQAHPARPVQPSGPRWPGRQGHPPHRPQGRGRGRLHGRPRRRDLRHRLERRRHPHAGPRDLLAGSRRHRCPGHEPRRRPDRRLGRAGAAGRRGLAARRSWIALRRPI